MTQSEALIQFFSPRTIEEQFLLSKCTSDFTREMVRHIPFFTADDTNKLFSCKSPESVLDTAMDILSHIQSDQKIPDNIEITCGGVQVILLNK